MTSTALVPYINSQYPTLETPSSPWFTKEFRAISVAIQSIENAVGPLPALTGFLYDTGGAITSVTVSGDGTLSSAGALVVTNTNGVAFAPSATTDTTNASNISSGTLSASRIASGSLPAYVLQPSLNATFLGNISGSTVSPQNNYISAATPFLSVFGASGSLHAKGVVPDPGATAGAYRFLREDCTWAPTMGTFWYNVNNYANLAAALTAAAILGGLVYIPGGTTVTISAAVTVPANVGIIGDGNAVSIIKQTTASANTLNVSNNYCALRWFSIQYASQGTGSGGVGSNGIYVTGAQTIIDGVYVYNAYIGIYCDSSVNGALIKGYSSSVLSTYVGIYLNACVNVVLDNVYISGNVGVPTYMTNGGLVMNQGCQGCTIKQVGIWSVAGGNLVLTGSGTYSTQPNECLFTNNYFDYSLALGGGQYSNCLFVANWFSGFGWQQTSGDCNSFIGNSFSNSSQDGFFLAGGKTTVISGGSAMSNSVSAVGAHNGISVGAGVTDFSITGVSCTNKAGVGGQQGWGILVAAGASDRYTIRNNPVSSNYTGGVSDGGAVASFTASISGSTMTVTGTPTGTIAIGQGVFDASGYVMPGTKIIGGSGLSWTVVPTQTVGSISMTSAQKTVDGNW